MHNPHHYAVIMAGGSGTRLWPMSRKSRPKQFQALYSERTMLQLMYDLLLDRFAVSHILVQTQAKFAAITSEQLPELPAENILLEPEARDTAPAFGFAAATLMQRDPEAVLGIFYSDHIIKNGTEFTKAIDTAFSTTQDFPEHITMIGVKPSYPHTGLGYIKIKNQASNYPTGGAFYVDSFVEKPELKVAEQFVKSWEYFWNTGYKICRADHLFSLIENLDTVMAEKLHRIAELISTNGSEKEIKDLYHTLPHTSFEYLATEKNDQLLVVPSDMEWTDIGDWKSLHDILMEETEHHMITRGNHMGIDCEHCLIYAGDKMIATVGLKNTIIVDTGDVLLVADKNKAQDIKKLLQNLKDQDKHTYI